MFIKKIKAIIVSKKFRRITFPIAGAIVLIILLLVSPIGRFIIASGNDLYTKLNVLQEIIRIVNDNYVDVPDWNKVMNGAYRGMLEQLDPHSVYIEPKELSEINEQFSGKFEGIGIEFDILEGYITVISPVAGAPAERAGLEVGDKIVKINGESAFRITREETMKKLRGPKGTEVTVTIRRAGLEDFDVKITRDEIPLYSVSAAFMLDDTTGYIFLNRFSSTTSQEVDKALEKLHKAGMRQLIFDLRNNSGGFLEQAVEVASKFIPGRQKIVYTRGRIAGANEDFYSTGGGKYSSLPLIVMINRGSASASEIVAGAIQDLDRGLITGETSFGKGLVQRQYNLRDGSALRVTVAKYYTPSGRLIQRPYNGALDEYYENLAEEDRDSVLAAEDSLKNRPQFKTAQGRLVYGGGGITPDYAIKYRRQITRESLRLLQHSSRVVFEFAATIASQNKKWSANPSSFHQQYRLSEADWTSFKKIAKEKVSDLDWQLIDKDADYLKILIKAEIARILWGYDEYYKVLRLYDNQVLESLPYFVQARSMVVNKK